MRPTPPEIPIEKRDNEVLIEDLCIALRNVGVWDHSLPDDPKALSFIEETKNIYNEIKKRKIEISERIAILSSETNWKMDTLLSECLKHPGVIPYVRNQNGLRRAWLCYRCYKEERPIGDNKYFLCTSCIQDVLESTRKKSPIDGIFLYRTFNKERWCPHGNNETIFADLIQDDILSGFGFCEKCMEEEIGRRHNLGATAV